MEIHVSQLTTLLLVVLPIGPPHGSDNDEVIWGWWYVPLTISFFHFQLLATTVAFLYQRMTVKAPSCIFGGRGANVGLVPARLLFGIPVGGAGDELVTGVVEDNWV